MATGFQIMLCLGAEKHIFGGAPDLASATAVADKAFADGLAPRVEVHDLSPDANHYEEIMGLGGTVPGPKHEIAYVAGK